ncbi:aminotransferase class I/II-fold pyridoxal phosphate-dependent enzyme [Aquiflexum lacus]|uniref:aminotransferase class I/II-fold pyridoxal phosphate-dependent enzyme n=1 Tax=Aquiflexum lacus TaxID=2483805 RepID=UPI001893C712|nr:aminotransferase class I/II-fold pyridoxal phosphate-dependent enzyme [Aquiflexum lacus]
MQSQNSLSHRGSQAADKPMRVDLEIYNQALENKYDEIENPKGTFPMNVAENHLCWEMLREKIQSITKAKDIPDWVSSYGDPAGVLSFREAAAKFLSEFLIKKEIPGDSLAFSAGATSVIEMTSFLLADHGDTAVIPAPSYPVYTADIGVVPGIKRFDLQTHTEINELKDGIPLSIDQLEKAKKEIQALGSRFRMLILTSPDNPTGGIYSASQLSLLASWCIENEIHLIVNEIYGLSPIDIHHPEIKSDYPNPIEFVSFGQLMAKKKNPYLHFWYSFSKDLGISGFRVGLLHSYNEELINGYRNAGLSHAVSNYTQWVLQELLEDLDFMGKYIAANQKALAESYVIVVSCLKELRIPFNPSYGSLFVWMDMSEFLPENSDPGQDALWLEIFEKTGILLTPGNGFGHEKKGLFRMVISSIGHQALHVAMGRLKKYILKKKYT